MSIKIPPISTLKTLISTPKYASIHAENTLIGGPKYASIYAQYTSISIEKYAFTHRKIPEYADKNTYL
jgi:hypothetical protein